MTYASMISMCDPLPFDLWFLEIDQKTEGPAGSSQIVEALRGMLIGEALDAF